MVAYQFIEEMAHDYFHKAIIIAKLDEPSMATDNFAIAYGLYRMVENCDLMLLSVRWLRHLGLEDEELQKKLNYGTGLARRGIDIADAVNRIFGYGDN